MEKKPFIGQKDRRITVSTKTFAANAVGERKETVVAISDAFAFMDDVSGGEDIEGKVRHLINRTYFIRYNPVVKAKANALVVIDDSKKYDVYHIKEIGRKRYLEIMVKDYE